MKNPNSFKSQSSLNKIIGNDNFKTGVSIFDPVLCEVIYRWFCPKNGIVIDPFAGGSVRGIVASKLGMRYVGIDLRKEQVDANNEQICILNDCDPKPKWIAGDSRNIIEHVGSNWVGADFLFSCPPYANLEIYSDDENDLSTLSYDEFIISYRLIIKDSCRLVNNDRFACFVVGDIRDKDGFYYGFPYHTIEAFADSGFRLYNDAVLVTPVGTLPIRAGIPFQSSRKLGKTHQNILIFCNGDPKKAANAIGPVDVRCDLIDM